MICDSTTSRGRRAPRRRRRGGSGRGAPFSFFSGGYAIRRSQCKPAVPVCFPTANPAAPYLSAGQRYRHDRIRLAYLSADFRGHPVSYLLAAMFECHDKSRFRIYGHVLQLLQFFTGATRDRKGVRSIRLTHGPTPKLHICSEAEIDIAIDLMGPTQGARPAYFGTGQRQFRRSTSATAAAAARPISTTSSPTASLFRSPSESCIKALPVCLDTFMGAELEACHQPRYAVTDRGGASGIRFCVFGAFSNSYKVSPQVFDIWMDLLRDVNSSVLWLSQYDEKAHEKANLRREAHLRGVVSGAPRFRPPSRAQIGPPGAASIGGFVSRYCAPRRPFDGL